MPDDVATQTAETTTGTGTSAGTQNTDTKTVPYDRFKEANDKAKDLEKRLKAFEDAETERAKKDADAESERLKKQGEFEKLAQQEKERADKLAPYEERAAKLEASLNKRWEVEKKDIPEYMLPLLEKMPVDERLDYITENREKWTKAAPNGVGSNPAGSTGKGLTSENQKEADKTLVGLLGFGRR